jgi:energy-converting hydrogenase Eha subunit B
MAGRIKSIIGGVLTGGVLSYLAVQYLFNPAMPEPAFEPVLGNVILSTLVFWTVSMLFFDWVVQNTGKTMLSGMVIAISQILLVDFNYVLIGRRELMPALISVGTLLGLWAAVAFVYDKLRSETP